MLIPNYVVNFVGHWAPLQSMGRVWLGSSFEALLKLRISMLLFCCNYYENLLLKNCNCLPWKQNKYISLTGKMHLLGCSLVVGRLKWGVDLDILVHLPNIRFWLMWLCICGFLPRGGSKGPCLGEILHLQKPIPLEGW